MKIIFFTLSLIVFIVSKSLSQTTLTEDANGVLNTGRIVSQTSSGQIFYLGHQIGSGYAFPYGIFRAQTDNPVGASNYYYDGITNGITNFSVRTDGQGYFAGNIGIGTTTPQANLELKAISAYDGTSMLRITNNSTDYGRTTLVLTGRIENGNDTWNFGSGARNSIVFAENAATTGLNIGAIGDEKFSLQLEGNSNSLGFLSKQNGNTPNVILTQAGNVCIGTTNPQGYLLAVNGSAIATSVTVKLNANWPDYVFKSDYKLPSLQEVKTYIDQNQHLQEMPSAEKVEKEGINLGEIVKLQTKKIEELTLYLIDKDKQIADQQKQINEQQQVNQSFQQQLNELTEQLKALKQQR